MERTDFTVGEYLLARLKEIGVDHLFGVPGDFLLGFLNQVLASDVRYIGTCNELNAAYAADGYARIKGIGCFATTYAVGELSALNGAAGAFAERVPVVAVTGAPSRAHFRARTLLHHTLGDYEIPLRIYGEVTCASTMLLSPGTAAAEIDRVLAACLSRQQPVYIGLPSDMVRQKCSRPGPFPFPAPAPSDPGALAEALAEAKELLTKAPKPLVIGDVELIRFKLQNEFARFLDRTGLPFVTMMLGKTVLSERHPQFVGLYQGERSRESVKDRVASAGGILHLGALLSDFNTGGFSTRLDEEKTISATIRAVKIKHHYYEDVNLRDFLDGLAAILPRRNPQTLDIKPAVEGCVYRDTLAYQPEPAKPVTIKRFFERMSHFVREGDIVVAETGVSLFSAAEMLMPEGATFLGQTFYGSIGYTVGAALGAAAAAKDRRVVLFIGDGSFQVTGQDLSTMIRNGLTPVIFLINNDGYTIERVITDHPYNDIQPWHYHRLVQVFGEGFCCLDVHTEGELENALETAKTADGVIFIEIHTGRLDAPETLRAAGRSMARSNHLD